MQLLIDLQTALFRRGKKLMGERNEKNYIACTQKLSSEYMNQSNQQNNVRFFGIDSKKMDSQEIVNVSNGCFCILLSISSMLFSLSLMLSLTHFVHFLSH